VLFRIYCVEKKPKTKNRKQKRKNQKYLPPFEPVVGASNRCFKATQLRPAATVANLPQIATTVGSYCPFKRRQEPKRRLKRGSRLFLPMLNPTIYFRKIEEKI
jgi:hypothetical protein